MGMKKTSHRYGRRYSMAEMKLLMELWRDGAELVEIARRLETTERAILHVVQRLRQEGVPLEKRTKGHKRGRAYKPWTQEEVEYLFRRRLAGATAEEIAHDLERTGGAVQQMIDVLRKEGAPVAMRGQGVRRLWSVEDLKLAATGRFDSDDISLAAEESN